MQGLASMDAGQWLGVAGLLIILPLVAWFERRPATWHLGFATVILFFGLTHLLLPGRTMALWTTLALVATIGAVSKLKYRQLGFNLLAGDLNHLAPSSFRGVLADHAKMVVPALFGMAAVAALTVTIDMMLDEPATPLPIRLEVFAAAACLYLITFRSSGGTSRFRFQLLTQDRAHLSAFVASLFGAGPSRRPAFVDIDAEPSPLLPPAPAKQPPGDPLPHIIMVLHESTFDPRRFGLPVDDCFARFFSPTAGLSGTLNVEVFGGSSLQSEFSILTGLSTRSFGSDSRYVFHLLDGRIRHSLPLHLSAIGYSHAYLSCDSPSFLNRGSFYRSVGLTDVAYAETLPPPFDGERWRREHHDEQLYDHALGSLQEQAASGKPCFLSISTLMNHGDHHRRVFADDLHTGIRREADAAAGSAEYGEYMVRLAETVRTYEAFRARLDATLDGHPAIVVRFGDHQPSFTASMTGRPPSDPMLYETFYTIEAVNCALPQAVVAPPALDVAYLSTLTLLAAGAPLDPVFATRAALLEAEPATYFDPDNRLKRRFHRALVEAGMIDLS
ncbi:sulfatase-like hydrolase/transferase [Mesorhizobium captivum]|uniref:sulfatase-like hydrolase/transferase n=1 Tax=Mesorhizobium captivum TaxID=3072319 RepID=UPI002A239EB2|nr:sulfatase-like hydrolase/transferase [Mesorhizobium sp. VK3C]MDX8447318.1 sulfatase-like hydrolase/transferase [Mesorhizobium sp. VK3C]